MRRQILAAGAVLILATIVSACSMFGGDGDKLPTNPSAAPIISSFAAESPSVTAAAPCTVLRWETVAATSVKLEASAAINTWELISSGLSLSGSRQVCPLASSKYRLTATNKYGPVEGFAAIDRK